MKKVIVLLFALLTFAGCASQGDLQPAVPTTVLNPMPHEGASGIMQVNLYFASKSEPMLVSESREIRVPANQRIEQAVLEELIAGPGVEVWEVDRLIDPDTQIISIEDDGNVITVTLSKHFLNSGDGDNMHLAVYSVVNTLVELAGFSRVQILVDTQETGNGQRLSTLEAGFDGDGVLEPLARNGEIVLDAGNTAKLIFDYMLSREYNKLYDLVANADENSGSKPGEVEFVSVLTELGTRTESFSIHDVILSADNANAVVMVYYTQREENQQLSEFQNVPISLVRENMVWKIRYSRLIDAFAS